MTILLFGVSNVGKSTIGKLLAHRLGYDFYDLDGEIVKHRNTSLEDFVSTGTLRERDEIRCNLLRSLIARQGDKVVAVTPLSHTQTILQLLSSSDIFSIELIDSVENIFDRLVFSDEQDHVYEDADYKNKHKDHYLKEIKEALEWYGSIYADIKHKFHMSGRSPENVVDALIKEYHLDREEA